MKNGLVQLLNKYSLYLVLVLLVLFFSITTEGFFTVPTP
jgi:ribose/xylose/arabinose/galactoside ABC-type transport system permease subunit